MKFLIGLVLVAEGLMSGLALTQDLPTAFAARDVITTLVVLARGLVGIFLFAGGWMLVRQSPVGPPVASAALIASAVLRVLELGFAFGPTNLIPSLRWPVAIGYGTFALVGALLLRRVARDESYSRPSSSS